MSAVLDHCLFDTYLFAFQYPKKILGRVAYTLGNSNFVAHFQSAEITFKKMDYACLAHSACINQRLSFCQFLQSRQWKGDVSLRSCQLPSTRGKRGFAGI